jgi:hypothetical protein
MVANCRNGISSHEVSRSLGVTQKTAWFMLHRIRTDYFHQSVNHPQAYVFDKAHTNTLENFWSLLKRGLKLTCPTTIVQLSG